MANDDREATASWLSRIPLPKLALVLALLTWGLLAAMGIQEQSHRYAGLPVKDDRLLQGLLLNAFLFNVYVYSWLRQRERPLADLYGYLWRGFIMAAVCALLSGVLNLLALWAESSPTAFKVLVHSLVFYVEFGLMLWLMLSLLAKWKSAVRYGRTRFVHYAWNAFELLLFATAGLHFFNRPSIDLYFYAAYAVLLLLALVLCVNMRWVGRLTGRQKRLALPLLLGILAGLGYFLRSMLAHFGNEPLMVDDISKSVFVLALFSFNTVYVLVALVAVALALPVASAAKQAMGELEFFKRLTRLLAAGQPMAEAYRLLLLQAMEASAADAGWLEVPGEQIFLAEKMTQEAVLQYQRLLHAQGALQQPQRLHAGSQLVSMAKRLPYHSMLAVPLHVGEATAGSLVLLKRLGGAFDQEMIDAAQALSAQTAAALQACKHQAPQATQTELRQGLAMAHKIKKRFTPHHIGPGEGIELYGLSYSEDGLGGDYYDYCRLSGNKYAVCIADVAGKGLPAAFTMALLKGVFQSLAPLNLMPNEFMKLANNALASNLEKGVFITASYYYIETTQKKVYFSRAGHCPTLYVDSLRESAAYFENNGLGLGIVTGEAYEKFIEMQEFAYAPGDLMVLYTDGIVEASPKTGGEEYGYERLRTFVQEHQHEPLEAIASGVVADVKRFIGADRINDDYTVMLVRLQ